MSKHNLHSPPPWVVPVVSNRGHITVLDDRGEHVVDLKGIRTEDNLPFLLRAVNSHAQLVSAIERFVAAAEDSCDASTDHDDVRAMLEYAEAFDQLRAAIAAAKGAA